MTDKQQRIQEIMTAAEADGALMGKILAGRLVEEPDDGEEIRFLMVRYLDFNSELRELGMLGEDPLADLFSSSAPSTI